MRKIIVLLIVILALSGVYFIFRNWPKPAVETKFVQNIRNASEMQDIEMSRIEIGEPGVYVLLESPRHVYQSFNNCGPATLSMMLSWYGVDAGQEELGRKMRPYQNPQGDNDDKTIFTSEFVDWAREYGLMAEARVNGDIEMIKRFTANGMPVVVKTWLKRNEDIGHFRIVTGFDEEKQVVIQDDSYDGPRKKISYYDFLAMWQPFNYAYIIVYNPEIGEKVAELLGDELEEEVAWRNALTRAERESELDVENPYPRFNMATSLYHLGDYEKAVEIYEETEGMLPRRMLWYQIEPILAYQKLGDRERAFKIIELVLSGGNRAFSELYMVRGEMYLAEGKTEMAEAEFEQALKYNENLEGVREKLEAM